MGQGWRKQSRLLSPTGQPPVNRSGRGWRGRYRRRGVLQRRFWEHAIRDEDDYARHFDYIRYNPR